MSSSAACASTIGSSIFRSAWMSFYPQAWPAAPAVGAVGSTHNYAAPLYHRLIEGFNRDHQDVAACMDKVIAIIRILVQYGGVAAGKLAMQLHGIDVGDPRRPLPMTSEQKRVALDAFALPTLFNSDSITGIREIPQPDAPPPLRRFWLHLNRVFVLRAISRSSPYLHFRV